MPGPTANAGFRPVPATGDLTLGDHRKYPACRVRLTCALCGWCKGYNPERIIERLRALNAGGHKSPVGQIARRVAWPCPGCGRVKWRADLAWPADLSDRAIKRLAAAVRN
ncbi:MAG TPA: hypothetical protein VHV27_05570 [Phenylobacterium sp.]|jgi:hypothetical protein|nr:hypothetical protein [Phenylobacterium sp.]